MTDLSSAVLGIGVGLTLWAFINLVFLDRREHAKLWRFSAILVVVVLAVGIFGVYEIYSLPPVTIAEKLGSTVGTRLGFVETHLLVFLLRILLMESYLVSALKVSGEGLCRTNP